MYAIRSYYVGDHVVHQPVHRERVLPRESLVDAHRLAVGVDEQVLGRARPAERQPAERLARLHGLGAGRRLGRGRDGAREWRLVAKAAGPVDGAQQAHEDAERAHRVKAVGVVITSYSIHYTKLYELAAISVCSESRSLFLAVASWSSCNVLRKSEAESFPGIRFSFQIG